MKIKKFKEYSEDLRLVENLTEFGFNHISATGVSGSGIASDSTQPNDPQLSTNGFDRWKNNVVNAQNRLMDIVHSIFKTDIDSKLGSNYIDYKLEKLKINRMYRNNNESIDIYLEYSFKNDPEKTYNAAFKNWGSHYKPTFISNMSESHNRVFTSRVSGLLKHSLEKWFKPKKGDYVLLKDGLEVWNEIGTKVKLKQGDKVKVSGVYLNNNNPVTRTQLIKLIKDNKEYKLTNTDFWYFNWWFEPIKKPKLRI